MANLLKKKTRLHGGSFSHFILYQSDFENLGFQKIDKDFGSKAEFYYPMKKMLNI
jgi:hypothetical protein